MDAQFWFTVFGTLVLAAPAALLAVLGGLLLVERMPEEQTIGRMTLVAVLLSLVAALAVLMLMIWQRTDLVTIEWGDWVALPSEHFHFAIAFAFDRLSLPFVILCNVLCGTVAAFASVYLRREPGYTRFFFFFALFFLGMIVTSVAGSIETLFFGWELVGVSSALLIAFFQDRPEPANNGQWVWSVYRLADAAFLLAAVALHHFAGSGEFQTIIGGDAWPAGKAALTSSQAAVVGGLLLVAAAGKSALVPFSGWLPRAMEGPTPSSAIFYGALSVHLGAYLLLRVSPILEQSWILCAVIVVVGLLSAVLGALSARVQVDVKSALAFSSLAQVGLIVAEIGIGLRYIALAHIVGHACLRTLQLLRAPMLLHDYQDLENAIGSRLVISPGPLSSLIPGRVRTWAYRFALERGYLDALLTDFVVAPFRRLFQTCDDLERRWTRLVSGAPPARAEQPSLTPEALERLQ